jgi:hypothetical protein
MIHTRAGAVCQHIAGARARAQRETSRDTQPIVHRDAEELTDGRAGPVEWTGTWHTTTVPARSWLAHHHGPTGRATQRSACLGFVRRADEAFTA